MNTGKKLLLSVTAIALLSLAHTNAQQHESLEGFMTGIRANAVKGSVPFQRRDGFYDLEPGLQLERDDILKSGSNTYYELLLQPGSYLRVGPDAELQLLDDQLDKMKLKLNQGAISFEIVTKADSNFYNPPEAYELIRVITPDAEVFVNGPGIFRINTSANGRTELLVRKGEAVINGRRVKKNQRAVTSNESVSVAEIDLKSEDSFDVWSRERADEMVRINKSLKETSPWAKRDKQGLETSVNMPENEQRGGNPYVVSAKPGAVNFVEDGVEFSRPQKDWEQLTEKAGLEPGDKVRTDEHSFAELMLFPDMHLRLGEGSEILFEQLSNDSISVKLLRGSAILDVARFDRKQSPQITLASTSGAVVLADRGNYRVDTDAITIRDGKVIFNDRSVGSCRRISNGTVSDCDKRRTDNLDFWSSHRGEGQFYDGTATVSMVAFLSRLRQQRFRNAGFWYQNAGQSQYTFVPFTSLLFRSPYGGSYSTVLSPRSNLNPRVDMRPITTIKLPDMHDPPPMKGPPKP
jgi:FecR protein